MRTVDLQRELVDWSVRNSGFDAARDYIGLSGIADCERVIYDRLREGQRASINEQLRTRISYELEAALVGRLTAMSLYYLPGETISLHGGLVQGHTDGSVSHNGQEPQEILEIKTLERETWLPVNGLISRRVAWQVQAYMHYLKRRYTHIVYLARDTGAILCLGLKYDLVFGGKIQAKVELLVKAVQETKRPRCTCRRCKENGEISVIVTGTPVIKNESR